MKRQVYLSVKPLAEAQNIFFSRFGPDQKTGVTSVKAEESDGRITAEPVFALTSAPSYHASAMDGIAVQAEQTYGATERAPMTLSLETDAAWVNTGQPLPKPFNAVIMIEDVHMIDDGHIEIRSSAYPWQHVRKVGEDIVATQLLFPQNHWIRPYDIGALISGGIFSVNVRKRPRVAIIPTGSELIRHEDRVEGESLGTGRIVEYNARVLAALVRECGGIPLVHDIVSDSEKNIKKVLRKCVDSEADMVIINAGSSAGSKDFTVHAIGEMGEVLVHGVAMMPGKPTILGVVAGKPVIGNPGYAVSAALSFDQFVKPMLYTFQGISPPPKPTIEVHPTRDIPSKVGTEEFLRVNIGRVRDRYVATPLARAAGSITTLTRAEGIIRIPALSEGIGQGQKSVAELLVNEEALSNTVVIIGSHDMTIDILGDEVRRNGGHVRISSGNVGSLGGLLAIRKGTCHMAGSHLLDTETGQYNLSYIKRYIPNMDITVFHLVLRDQGLILTKGNPKAIKGVQDLLRKDVMFVNRQAGSGTRVLFDYKRNQAGVSSDKIRGYDHEEFTHMAVAVDVLSGAADCGMGIHAAARALNLDFVPIEQEQYDLIVPTRMLDQPNIQSTLNTMRSDNFRKRVADLGGYDPSKSGERFAEVKSG
ncbi:MAG: molybdopterin biosynthesis protein [Desulfobacteraceae bacterium 4572_87]|nr:MAG: molybdopterin biosynthesis protein [Desulfobacteraceae bacterium 4572_87]